MNNTARFRIGDRIRIIHGGKSEDGVYSILDIIEYFDDRSYWLKSEKGQLLLRCETPMTVFEKSNE